MRPGLQSIRSWAPRGLLGLALLAGGLACESVAGATIPSGSTTPAARSATAILRNAQSQEVAVATITDGLPPPLASPSPMPTPTPAMGVTVAIQVFNLPPGTHGFHLHQVGRCEPPLFTSSDGHLNPGGQQHGVKNPSGPHAGDLPNLTVDRDGTARALFGVDHLTFAQLASAAQGTSLVIDAGPDDDVTDPTGGSPPHLACGVLTMNGAATAAPPTPTPSPTMGASSTPTTSPSSMMRSPSPMSSP